MTPTLCILSIGSSDPIHSAYDSFLKQHNCDISAATTLLELYAISMRASWDIAVLLSTLSRKDLQESAHFVRRRWPSAKILVIRADAQSLDDALYDDRVAPGVNPEVLLAAIHCLVGNQRRAIVQGLRAG
jgi:DNA-binding response OmpR family regulator